MDNKLELQVIFVISGRIYYNMRISKKKKN